MADEVSLDIEAPLKSQIEEQLAKVNHDLFLFVNSKQLVEAAQTHPDRQLTGGADPYHDAQVKNWLAENPRGERYGNYVSLVGNPTEAVQKLLGKTDAAIFANFTPEQLSALMPKIKLIKVIKKTNDDFSEKELPFTDYTTPESITNIIKTRQGRAPGVQIVSVDYELNGEAPSLASNATIAIKIKFQNLEDLGTLGINTRQDSPQYIDLIMPRSQVKLEQKASAKGWIIDEPDSLRIKLICGWSTPLNRYKLLTSEQRRAVRNTQTTFYLGLKDHTIQINEDGTIDLEAEYLSRAEGVWSEKRANLLRFTKDEVEELRQLKGEASARRQNFEDERKRINKSLKERGLQDFLKGLDYDEILQLQDELINSYKKNVEESGWQETRTPARTIARSKLGEIAKILEEVEAPNVTQAEGEADEAANQYNLSATTLRGEKYVILGEKLFEKVREVRLTAEQLANFMEIQKKITSGDLTEITLTGLEVGLPSGGSGFRAVLPDPKKEELVRSIGKEMAKPKQPSPDQAIDFRLSNYRSSNEFAIKYILFGDIVDAAFEALKENGVSTTYLESVRLILSSINLTDPLIRQSFNNKEFYPMADIPIAWNKVNNFLIDKMLNSSKMSYLLMEFITDIYGQMLISAISKVSADFSTFGDFTIPDRNFLTFPMPPMANGVDRITQTTSWGGSYLTSNIQRPPLRENPDPETKKSFDYVLLNAPSNIIMRELKKNYNDDAAQGIVHLFPGADRGIVKSVKYEREDDPDIQTVRIANANKEEGGLPLLKNVYNAKIEMWGNTLFWPGMILYVNPVLPGAGDIQKRIAIAEILGLGGYYLVTKVNSTIDINGFKTTVSARFQATESTNPKDDQQNVSVVEGNLQPGEALGQHARLGNSVSDFRKYVKTPRIELKDG